MHWARYDTNEVRNFLAGHLHLLHIILSLDLRKLLSIFVTGTTVVLIVNKNV